MTLTDAFTLRQHFTSMFKAAQVMPRESFIIALVRVATKMQDADSSLTAENAAKLAYAALSGPTEADSLSELSLEQLEREHADAVRQHGRACMVLSDAEKAEKLALQRLDNVSAELRQRSRAAHIAESVCCNPTHPSRLHAAV